VVTQLLVNRRENSRWNRERERERALWAREDAARSYEHRRAAYVDFTKEFHRQREEIVRDDTGRLPDLVPLYDRLIQLQIFGTNEAAQLADSSGRCTHRSRSPGPLPAPGGRRRHRCGPPGRTAEPTPGATSRLPAPGHCRRQVGLLRQSDQLGNRPRRDVRHVGQGAVVDRKFDARHRGHRVGRCAVRRQIRLTCLPETSPH
jgi:hypothetical protein